MYQNNSWHYFFGLHLSLWVEHQLISFKKKNPLYRFNPVPPIFSSFCINCSIIILAKSHRIPNPINSTNSNQNTSMNNYIYIPTSSVGPPSFLSCFVCFSSIFSGFIFFLLSLFSRLVLSTSNILHLSLYTHSIHFALLNFPLIW